MILSTRQLCHKNAWNKEVEIQTGYIEAEHLKETIKEVKQFAMEINPKFIQVLKYKFGKSDYMHVSKHQFKFWGVPLWLNATWNSLSNVANWLTNKRRLWVSRINLYSNNYIYKNYVFLDRRELNYEIYFIFNGYFIFFQIFGVLGYLSIIWVAWVRFDFWSYVCIIWGFLGQLRTVAL